MWDINLKYTFIGLIFASKFYLNYVGYKRKEQYDAGMKRIQFYLNYVGYKQDNFIGADDKWRSFYLNYVGYKLMWKFGERMPQANFI